MQIVILGAGYAGLRAALDLDHLRAERNLALTVTLVDQHPYHQLIQLLHLTATAGIHSRTAIYDLPRLLRDRAVEHVEGRVSAISPLAHQITLADGRQISYDRLVITIGGESNYGQVPGAREHTLPLRTYPQAIALRDHFMDQFRAAAAASDPTARRVAMTTAIVGGGYTGCQLAGELAAWSDDLCQQTGAPRGEVRVALLEREPHLLAQLGAWASRAAIQELDRAGVSVYLSTPIASVEPQLLRLTDGRVLRAGTIVWSGGVRAPALLADAGLQTDDAGRVVVDRYLRAAGQAAIFAAGDCAAIPDGADTVPATASYAMRQGSHLAEALADEAAGIAPRPYEPLPLGEIVSLGPHAAVGNPLGVPVSGYPALMMKKGIVEYYRATIERA